MILQKSADEYHVYKEKSLIKQMDFAKRRGSVESVEDAPVSSCLHLSDAFTVCLFVFLFVCLFVCLFFCLFVCL